MTTWTTDELDRIGTADELEITTARSDGSLRRWVPIWVVRVDDDLYVRSYRGADGAWYRQATQHAQGRIRAGGVERDVTVDRPDDTVSRRSTTPTGPSTPATAPATCSRCSPPEPPRPRCG